MSENENFVMLWVGGKKYLVGAPLADAVTAERNAAAERAEKAEAERDAALSLIEGLRDEVELFRETLADNEAYCASMKRERDEAITRAQRAGAALSGHDHDGS